jgi:thioredoxin-related protein
MNAQGRLMTDDVLYSVIIIKFAGIMIKQKAVVVLLLVLSVVSVRVAAQADAEGSLVKWMTLKEAQEKIKTQPKPIIMDFYTDWCGWCKTMMKTTYANPDLAAYINQNFYPVKFNAETKDTIEYLGQKYGPVGEGQHPTNALAIKLLQNKLMYPTTLFLNNYDKTKNEFGFSMIAQGYLETNKIEPILVYMLENAFRNSNYDDFKVQFDKAFFDTANETRFKKMTWLKPTEYFNRDSSKKKALIMVTTDWCNTGKIMKRTSFNDAKTEKYLKEKFDLVDFNPEITDEVVYKGQKYINPRSPQMPFHQLAMLICGNTLTLPSMVIVDEKMNLLDGIPFYLNPEVLSHIATFYGDNIYKSKSWTDYMNSGYKK